MSIQNSWYKTLRWNDFWGWLNVRDSNDAIDDKQWQVWNNVISEGNKLVTINWYTEYVTLWAWVTPWQAISLYSGKIIAIHNRNLYVYDTWTWNKYTYANAVGNASDVYSIITTKSFSWNIAIVCINQNINTTEDITAYEFDTVANTFAVKTFSNLSDKNFKAGLFNEGKLLLGGNPKFPSSLYSSKTWSVSAPNNLYDFGSWSAYDSSAQNIWDWEPIVGIVSNHNELFVFKTNSVWRMQWTKDTWTAFAYIFKQEAATWALNGRCILPVEQDVIYFDGINFRRMSYEENINALNDDSISKDISPLVNGLPKDQKWNATMYYVYPFVKLFLRDKFSTNNSVAILYNVVDKSYSTQSWIECIQWVGGFINNKRTAYFLTSQTSTVYQDNIWTTFNWGNIMWSHLSKRYVLWDWVDYKRISQVELYWLVTPWLKGTIDIYVNGNIIDTRDIFFKDDITPTTWATQLWDTLLWGNNEANVTSLRPFVVRYEYFNDGRDFMFWFRWVWQWRMEIHGLNLMYKQIRAYDLHS